MIRGGIRLGILYLVVWAVCANWDAAADFYQQEAEWLLSIFPFSAKVNLFLAFLGMASFWHLVCFWFWVYTIKLDPRKGPVRSPLPVQPIRYYFRLRLRKTTGAIVSSLVSFLFALQTLQNMRFFSFDSAPFSFVYNLSWLPEFGSRTTPWLVYGVVHLGMVVMGWILLTLMVIKRKHPSVDGSFSFIHYQAKHNPVAKVFAITVLVTHFPFAAITAVTHTHPFHGLIVLCSLIGILLAALLGQAISLGIVRRHDRWLDSLINKARLKGQLSGEYKIWESTLIFLTGEKPLPMAEQTAAEPKPFDFESEENRDPSPNFSSGHRPKESDTKPKQQIDKSEKENENNQTETRANIKNFLVKAKVYLESNRVKKLRRLAGVLTVIILAVGVIGTLGLSIQWSTLPGADETRQLARSAHVHVNKKKIKGETKLELFGNRYDYSLNISLDNISKHFQNAVIASEDHRFYDHGISYILAKFTQAGFLCTLKKLNPFSDGDCYGNSTLPQQLARNLFLSEKRSIPRKISELLWALKMELGLSKEEIFDFYLNRIYLGNGNYGVEMAARDYFNKNASALKTNEAAFLAAAIKRPSWNWHQDREKANKRARLILTLMKKHGFAESKAAMPENFKPRLGYKNLHKPYLGHLWQWAKGNVEPIMRSLPDGKYKILTTLNAEVEIYAEKALNKEITRLKNIGKPVNQGAVVIMRPNGEVLAMVGGVGLKGRYFNRAKRTEGLLPRPPASAFKPFVYLAALESGLKPNSLIPAGPVSIPTSGKSEPYQPENHDGKIYKNITLRDGLVYSINTAAVHLLYSHVGFKKLLATVERLGIETDTLGKQWGLALGQSGISLIEMVGAYAVFANGGNEVKPYTVTSITSESGKTIWRRPEERTERVFQKEHISNINSMLSDVVRLGTGKRAAYGLAKKTILAGKTGTGDDFVDAWFIGYTSDLVIGVWIGNDKPVTMDGVYGGTGPARVFNDILRKLTDYTNITTGTGTLP